MLRKQKCLILVWSICYTLIALKDNVRSSARTGSSVGWKAVETGDEDKRSFPAGLDTPYRGSIQQVSTQTDSQKEFTSTSNVGPSKNQNISNVISNLDQMHKDVDLLHEIVHGIFVQQNDDLEKKSSNSGPSNSSAKKEKSKIDSETIQRHKNVDHLVQIKEKKSMADEETSVIDSTTLKNFNNTTTASRSEDNRMYENVEKTSNSVVKNKTVEIEEKKKTVLGNLTSDSDFELYATTLELPKESLPIHTDNTLTALNSNSNSAYEIISSTEFSAENARTESPQLDVENLKLPQIFGVANEFQSAFLKSDSEVANSNEASTSVDQNSTDDVFVIPTETDLHASTEENVAALGKITQTVKFHYSMDLKETSLMPNQLLQKIREYRSDDFAPPIPTTMYGEGQLKENEYNNSVDSVTASLLPIFNQNFTDFEISKVTFGAELLNKSENDNSSTHFLGKSSMYDRANNSNEPASGTIDSSTVVSGLINNDGNESTTDAFNKELINKTGSRAQLDNNSSKPYTWKRICFQNVKEIRHSLEDNIIKLPENKADMYIFYYVPTPKKEEESILYLSNSNVRYPGGYMKYRYTENNDSYDDKYSAFSLQHHKMVASYHRAKSGSHARSSVAKLKTSPQFNAQLVNKNFRLGQQKGNEVPNVGNSNQKIFDFVPNFYQGDSNSKKSGASISARTKRETEISNSTTPQGANYYCTYVPFYNNVTFEDHYNGGKASDRAGDKDYEDEENKENEKKGERSKRHLANLHSAAKVPPSVCDLPQKWCADRSRCIPEKSWCNNIIDCLDKSDEVDCSCKDHMDADKVCDGFFDCPNGDDEKGCFGCSQDMFSCDDWSRWKTNATCVNMNQRCDFIHDCPNGKDERDCEILTETIDSHDMFQTSYTTGYMHRNWKGIWYPVCIDTRGDDEWAINACVSELGTPVKHVEIEILPFFNHYDGHFLTHDETNFVKFVDFCTHPGYAVHVTCPSIACGSRIPHEDFYSNYRARRNTETISTGDFISDLLTYIMKEEGDFDVASRSRTRRNEERVVGGEFSIPGRWPWLVALYKNGNFHCGGAILDETWVLSAAHCVKDYPKHYYEVQAGILRRYSFSPSEQTRMVTHAIIHPEYHQTDMSSDLALLKLDEPLKFNRWVRPTCLPEAKPPWGPPPGTLCTAVGWGSTKERGPDPDNMKEVIMPILPTCKHKADRENDEICAGYLTGGKDTCQGDSGGPLLCRIPLTRDRWYVGGIVSHGEGCGRPFEPGAYTRIALFLPWLLKNTDDTLLTEVRKTKHECPGLKCIHGGRCIGKKKICDTVIDCLSAEDELSCEQFFQPSEDSPYYEDVPYIKFLNNETSNSDNQSSGYSLADMKHRAVETNESFSVLRSADAGSDNLVSSGIYSFSEDGNVTNNFICAILHQTVPTASYCNGETDCEDGTDEIDCTCRDFLKTYNHSLLCDGVIHCHDLSDETECADRNCSITEFFCYKSRKCIDRQLVCDGVVDCPQSEDENVCYAVIPFSTNVMEDRFDIFEKPLFAKSGNLAHNEKGVWKWLCAVRDEKDPEYYNLMVKVAKQLGYNDPGGYLNMAVYNDTLFSKNNTAEICTGLTVISWLMQIDDEVVLPWFANIYVNGELKCVGVLLEDDWIMADYNCCAKYSTSSDYIVVTLGAMKGISRVIRSYREQIIVVDKMLYRPQFKLVLLHLKDYVEITERTKPLFMPSIATRQRSEERCILVVNNLQNSTVYELKFERNCSSEKKCYSTQNKTEFCSSIKSDTSYSVVLCIKREEKWYLSSYVPSGDMIVCSRNDNVLLFDSQPGSYNLNLLEKTVFIPPINCQGYRCKLGKCNPWMQMCDGKTDCRENEDERKPNCEIYNMICEDGMISCACKIHEFRCKNGRCVSRTAICDGKDDCLDNSDEPANCSSFTCADYFNLINPRKLCDGHQDCFDKTDENITVCPSICDLPSSFYCSRSNVCIPMDFVCDGERDCAQGEDEKNCSSFRYTTGNSTVGTIWMQSNGKWQQECLTSEFIAFDAHALCTQFGFDHVLHVETVPGSKHISTPFITVKLNEKIEIVINKKLQNDSMEMEPCSYLHLSCGYK